MSTFGQFFVCLQVLLWMMFIWAGWIGWPGSLPYSGGRFSRYSYRLHISWCSKDVMPTVSLLVEQNWIISLQNISLETASQLVFQKFAKFIFAM